MFSASPFDVIRTLSLVYVLDYPEAKNIYNIINAISPNMGDCNHTGIHERLVCKGADEK
jgi:hypothetical protein